MQFSPTREVQPELIPEVLSTPRNKQLGNAPLPRPVLYDRDLSANQKIVFVALLDFCRPGKHHANIALRKLAEYLGMSDKTVRVCIDQLYERGYILSIVQHQGKRGNWFNVYSLRMFPYPAERPRKPRAKRNPVQKRPRLYLQEEQQSKLPIDEPVTQTAQSTSTSCSLCNGTGYQVIEKDGSSGVIRCACKAQKR